MENRRGKQNLPSPTPNIAPPPPPSSVTSPPPGLSGMSRVIPMDGSSTTPPPPGPPAPPNIQPVAPHIPHPPPIESSLTVKSTISQDRTKGKDAFRSQLLRILQDHAGRNDAPPKKALPGRPPNPFDPLPRVNIPPGSQQMKMPPPLRPRSRSRSRSVSPRSSSSGSEGYHRRRRRRRRVMDYSSADDSYVSSYQSESEHESKRTVRRRTGRRPRKTPEASPGGGRAKSKLAATTESAAAVDAPAVDEPETAQLLKMVQEQLNDSGVPVEPQILNHPQKVKDEDMSLHKRLKKNVGDTPNINLYDDSPESRLFGRLLETIKKLELEKDHIAREFRAYRRGFNESDESVSESDGAEAVVGPDGKPKATEIQPKYEIHHLVECDEDEHKQSGYAVFFDPPALYAGDDADGHLQGKEQIKNVKRRLDTNKNIVFVVEREYVCRHYQVQLDAERDKGLIDRFDRLRRDGPKASVNFENIRITNNDLLDVLNSMIVSNQDTFPNYPIFELEIPAPYLFFYHHRSLLEEKAKDPSDPRNKMLVPLLDFMKETYQEEWDEADALFANGETSSQHIAKLFKPGEIVVSRKEGKLIGYEVSSWPTNFGTGRGTNIATTTFMFHGYFFRSTQNLTCFPPMKERLNNATFPIKKLETYPLRFCGPEVREELIARGKKFWSVRNRMFVCYNGWDFEHEEKYVNTRFMVDFMTYKRMHPREASILEPPAQFRLTQEEMAKDEPPGGNFVLMLPANVYGFNLLDKKWNNLSVDQIEPIKWNKKAFDRLVVKPKVKELIKALVSVHIDMGKSADIVTGKGNGLIVLLHGGPGTGKTLTAETVAELAEKPLYRVTCGDIGTNPEAIEKYLETVLYIGELWGCVVLLDEADVFLEERSLADLERNAMVSVFLRVLEYYEGILVLTSNRVGTFDEAFKSRIQLALHYPTLSESDRRKIWNNFLKTLDEIEENVDLADLEDHLDDLCRHRMNGRQIRNAVTTARQLAQYRRQTLDYGHFDHVISTMVEFDQYLQKTHRHTDDQWAREEGVRYN